VSILAEETMSFLPARHSPDPWRFWDDALRVIRGRRAAEDI
jgi:hypothetical protein